MWTRSNIDVVGKPGLAVRKASSGNWDSCSSEHCLVDRPYRPVAVRIVLEHAHLRIGSRWAGVTVEFRSADSLVPGLHVLHLVDRPPD